MYLVQCNSHLASCIEEDGKGVFVEKFGVTFRNSLLMVPHATVCCVSVFFFFFFMNLEHLQDSQVSLL